MIENNVETLTSDERAELEHFRSIMSTVNASIYILNKDPYKLEWVNENKCVNRLTGMDPSEVIKKGEFIPSYVPNTPDFEESVIKPTKHFDKDPSAPWGGVYRIKDTNGKYNWVFYSAATLEVNENGKQAKAAVVALPLEDIFNTPMSLHHFHRYLTTELYKSDLEKLTSKQIEVLRLIRQGKGRKEIAESLGISSFTFDDHKSALLKKLDCKNSIELGILAYKMGLD